eukprot:m.324144 g.324144  ORF g.324144 m.324144 type:complete len:82 (+) comp16008_c0_seq4:1483-1728(+)
MRLLSLVTFKKEMHCSFLRFGGTKLCQPRTQRNIETLLSIIGFNLSLKRNTLVPLVHSILIQSFTTSSDPNLFKDCGSSRR